METARSATCSVQGYQGVGKKHIGNVTQISFNAPVLHAFGSKKVFVNGQQSRRVHDRNGASYLVFITVNN